jgi:DNA-binding FadR family transcriptional regulator
VTTGSAYARALDAVGSAIVSGAWPAGRAETVDGLVASTGVSRSIVREVTRELAAAGLLAASPRVGLTAQPRSGWDLLDRRVVRWRLRVGDRGLQLRELRQLRVAVEPEAAALAARRRPDAEVAVLRESAAALLAADGAGDEAAFLAADQRFHRALMRASGNATLAALSALIDEVLEDRALVERHGLGASPVDAALHVEVAAAVADGSAADARSGMRSIVERTGAEEGER